MIGGADGASNNRIIIIRVACTPMLHTPMLHTKECVVQPTVRLHLTELCYLGWTWTHLTSIVNMMIGCEIWQRKREVAVAEVGGVVVRTGEVAAEKEGRIALLRGRTVGLPVTTKTVGGHKRWHKLG
jgi:hypothetical protein